MQTQYSNIFYSSLFWMQLFDLYSGAVSSNKYKLCTYSASSLSFHEIHVCFLSLQWGFYVCKKDLHMRGHLPDIKLAPFRPDSCCCIPLCLKLRLMCYQRSKTCTWVFQVSVLITSGTGVACPCAVSCASLTKCLLAPALKRGDERVSMGVLPTLKCYLRITAAQLHQGLASLWFPVSKT